jgi:hydroxyacylglutathione hydrolase
MSACIVGSLGSSILGSIAHIWRREPTMSPHEEPRAMLQIERLPLLQDNYAWLILDPETGTSGVVDPAVAAPVLARLKALGRGLDWILATHHHGDHVGGNLELKAATGCRVAGAEVDAHRIPGIDLRLAEGDSFAFGSRRAEIIATPGHTAGHISYWFADDRALFCADTLFALGCGKLLEGDAATMQRSLAKLRALPEDALVYCGHEYTLANARFALTVDPDNAALRQRAALVAQMREKGEATVPSTLGEERATNPFLRWDDPGIRRGLGMAGASDAAVLGEIRSRKDRF